MASTLVKFSAFVFKKEKKNVNSLMTYLSARCKLQVVLRENH